MNAFIAPDSLYGPPGMGPPGLVHPGLVHPLLVEKYAWVDARLEKMCSVVEENDDNYQNFKLLTENEDWLEKWMSMDEKIKKTTKTIQSYNILYVKIKRCFKYKKL